MGGVQGDEMIDPCPVGQVLVVNPNGSEWCATAADSADGGGFWLVLVLMLAIGIAGWTTTIGRGKAVTA